MFCRNAPSSFEEIIQLSSEMDALRDHTYAKNPKEINSEEMDGIVCSSKFTKTYVKRHVASVWLDKKDRETRAYFLDVCELFVLQVL